MENFSNPAVIWFVLGFVLLLIEFAVPGLVLFFFAVGAWIVALVTLFIPVSVNSQLIIFSAVSAISVLLFRNWLKKVIWKKETPSSFIDDEFIGKTAKAETLISPHKNGKIEFRGTSWEARSEDFIEANEKVIITGNNSIVLNVKSTKSL